MAYEACKHKVVIKMDRHCRRDAVRGKQGDGPVSRKVVMRHCRAGVPLSQWCYLVWVPCWLTLVSHTVTCGFSTKCIIICTGVAREGIAQSATPNFHFQ